MPISTIGQNGLNAPLSLTSPALGTPSSLVLTNATGLPQAGLGTNVAGNGPAFSYYQSSNQSLSNGTFTKLTFTTSEFDTTSGMFASSRFTPTVAGYYQINGSIQISNAAYALTVNVNKNGSEWKRGVWFGNVASVGNQATVSAIVYCNGSTDYIEIYGFQNSGSSNNTNTGSVATYFQGVLVRSA